MLSQLFAAALLPAAIIPAPTADAATSISITINGTRIDITAPGNGKPIITTDGETVTPSKEPSKSVTPSPSATPSPSVTPSPSATPAAVTTAPLAPIADADPAKAVADRIFELTNQFRAENDLEPFERDTCLDGTAEEKSQTLIDTGTFAHGNLDPIAAKCDLPGVGENIAMVSGGDPDTQNDDEAVTEPAGKVDVDAVAAEIVTMWKNSTEGHREAMLSTDYKAMGAGAANNGSGFHATQHFRS